MTYKYLNKALICLGLVLLFKLVMKKQLHHHYHVTPVSKHLTRSVSKYHKVPQTLLTVKSRSTVNKNISIPTTTTLAQVINPASLDELQRIFNQLGSRPKVPDMLRLTKLLKKSQNLENEGTIVLTQMQSVYDNIQRRRYISMEKLKGRNTKLKSIGARTKIYLATIACGNRTMYEAMIMLKSAALFSLDAALHVIIFSDDAFRLQVAQKLLELQWTVNAIGGEMTFELHHEWFPFRDYYIWKQMYALCATQRLFFPSLLSHIDSLIFLDADTIVISNLTELWAEFSSRMKHKAMIALTQNGKFPSEYYEKVTFPYILPAGANAGVMLMNLTRLRKFKFEKRAQAIYTAYKERFSAADQDIINMIFGVFSDKAITIDCSYNFFWVYCGYKNFTCHNATRYNKCFCKAVSEKGARIIHGLFKTFYTNHTELTFLPPLYQAFQKLDLITDSYFEMFGNLTKQFDSLKHRPCAPLTSDDLYRNSNKYLISIESLI